jgi:hypothetical protein
MRRFQGRLLIRIRPHRIPLRLRPIRVLVEDASGGLLWTERPQAAMSGETKRMLGRYGWRDRKRGPEGSPHYSLSPRAEEPLSRKRMLFRLSAAFANTRNPK